MTDVTGTPVKNKTAPGISEGEAAVIGFGRKINWSTFAPPLVFIAMLLAVSVLNSNYLGALGISIATATAAPIMFLALGQSMVLNIGSIDLSNAAIALLGALLLALAFTGLNLMPREAAAADEIKWFDDMKLALAEAKKTGKPVFMEIR